MILYRHFLQHQKSQDWWLNPLKRPFRKTHWHDYTFGKVLALKGGYTDVTGQERMNLLHIRSAGVPLTNIFHFLPDE